MNKYLLLIFYTTLAITVNAIQETESSLDSIQKITADDNKDVNITTIDGAMESAANKLSLTYGSLLEINCKSNEDCILKNSVCNSYTKRCECDFNAIEDGNRCQTLRCKTNEDCWTHFENTICVFGNCRCKLGLKANGKCVDIDIPGIGSKSMPDWAISLIAIAALLSGIYGGRSQYISQLLRQSLSILILVLRVITMNNGNNGQRNPQQQQSQQQQIIDELSSVMTNAFNDNLNGNIQPEQQQDKRRPSIPTISCNVNNNLDYNNQSEKQPSTKQNNETQLI